jgi:hypothetical protein
MLRPYSGNRAREHFGPSPGRHTIRSYGLDTSGRISYAFNSLGFRGEEFDPKSKAKLFTCGCSYAFGTGVAADATWVALFARRYATHFGLGHGELCAMNFSQGGCSNGYIARTLISQSAAVAPDLLVAHFTHCDRTEYFLEGDALGGSWPDVHMGAVSIGPWLDRRWHERLTLGAPAPREKRPLARRLHQWARSYYRHTYREIDALGASIQAMLLLQLFCRERAIPFLFCSVDHERLRQPELQDHPEIGPLLSLLDPERVLDFAATDRELCVDLATDGSHPGPASNELFAERLWGAFVKLESSGRAG